MLPRFWAKMPHNERMAYLRGLEEGVSMMTREPGNRIMFGSIIEDLKRKEIREGMRASNPPSTR